MIKYTCEMEDAGYKYEHELVLGPNEAARKSAEQYCAEAAEYDDLPRVIVTTKAGGRWVFEIEVEFDPVFYASEVQE